LLRGKSFIRQEPISKDLQASLKSQADLTSSLSNGLNTSETDKTNDTDRIVYALAEVKNSVDNLTAV
jgi:hypothetical protein